MLDNSENFMFELLKRISAKILLQNRACNGSAAEQTLNTLAHVTKLYLNQLAIVSKRFAEHSGRTEPNVIDVAQAMEDCQVDFEELFIYAQATSELNNGPSNPFRGLNIDLEHLKEEEEEEEENKSVKLEERTELPVTLINSSGTEDVVDPTISLETNLINSSGTEDVVDSTISLETNLINSSGTEGLVDSTIVLEEKPNNITQEKELKEINDDANSEESATDHRNFLQIEGPDEEFKKWNPFPEISEQSETEGTGVDAQDKPTIVNEDPEQNSFTARLPESVVTFLRQRNRLNKLPIHATSDIPKTLEFIERRRKELKQREGDLTQSAVADHDSYYKESYRSLKKENSDITKIVTGSPFAKLPFDFNPPSGNSATVGQAIGTFDTPITDLFHKNSLSSTIAHFINSPPRSLSENEYSSLKPYPLPSFVPKPPTPPELTPANPIRIITKLSSPDTQSQPSKDQFPKIKAVLSNSGPSNFNDISSDEDLLHDIVDRTSSYSSKVKNSSHLSKRTGFIDPLIANSITKSRGKKSASSSHLSNNRNVDKHSSSKQIYSHVKARDDDSDDQHKVLPSSRKGIVSLKSKDLSGSSRSKIPKVTIHLNAPSSQKSNTELSSTSDESDNDSRHVRFKEPISKEYLFSNKGDPTKHSTSRSKSKDFERIPTKEPSPRISLTSKRPSIGSTHKSPGNKIKSILKTKVGHISDRALVESPRRNYNNVLNDSPKADSPIEETSKLPALPIKIKINLKEHSVHRSNDPQDSRSPAHDHRESDSHRKDRKEKKRRPRDELEPNKSSHRTDHNLETDEVSPPKKKFVIKLRKPDNELETSSSKTPSHLSTFDDEPTEEVKCICRSPKRDYGEFMIACDRCKRWLHGPCVDITEATAPNFWKCPRCRSESKKSHKSSGHRHSGNESSHRSRSHYDSTSSPLRVSKSDRPPKHKRDRRTYDTSPDLNRYHKSKSNGNASPKKLKGNLEPLDFKNNLSDSIELSMTSDEN